MNTNPNEQATPPTTLPVKNNMSGTTRPQRTERKHPRNSHTSWE